MLQVVPSSSSSLVLSSFDDSVKLLDCRDGLGCSSSSISLLKTVPEDKFFPLPLPTNFFSPILLLQIYE